MAAAAAHQEPGPKGVDGGRQAVDEQPLDRQVERDRVHEAGKGLPQDQERGDDDHDAFEHGAEELGLVMPEGMRRIGGSRCDPDRDQRGDGGRHVDGAFERIGEERDGTGDPPGQGLQAEDKGADADAADGKPDGGGHG